MGLEAGHERIEGRSHQHHWTCLSPQPASQCGAGELPDVLFGPVLQHLDQPQWPASSRKFDIQGRMASRNNALFHPSQLLPLPDIGQISR